MRVYLTEKRLQDRMSFLSPLLKLQKQEIQRPHNYNNYQTRFKCAQTISAGDPHEQQSQRFERSYKLLLPSIQTGVYALWGGGLRCKGQLFHVEKSEMKESICCQNESCCYGNRIFYSFK